MTRPRRILVATDFSPDARAAYESALSLSGRTGAQVDVVYVWQPPQGVPLTTQAPRAGSRALSDLARSEAMRGLRHLVGGSGAHPRMEIGVPHEVLVTLAASERFDLLLMGATGHGREPRGVGSVTRRVLDVAPCPVLTLRSTTTSPRAEAGVAS
ncbi:MAG: universal stress protein [Polyangiaceae bacterium]|nr:universal stress protein [Polyangiaceae bacterium]